MKKFVYSFNEGSKDMKDLLGGKGANLAEMTKIGLPVPFGFTVTTEACNRYYDEGKKIGDDIVASIFEKLEELEQLVVDARFECTGPYAKLTTTEYAATLTKMLGIIRSMDEVNES